MYGLLVVNLKNKLIMKGRFQMEMLNTINECRVWRECSDLKTNNLYNMDCLEGLRKMPDNSVDLILSDPPYALDNSDGIGTGVAKDYKYLKEIDYMCNGFDLRILDECMRVLRGNAFFFCSKDQIPMYIKYFAGTDMNIQVLTWSKTDAPPLCCGKYLSDTEYIIYAYRADSADKYPLITDHFITKKLRGNRNDPLYHPCKKPTEILSTLIQSASKEGDVVLDMFAGSASTMISCIETGRRYIGFELMEKYYNAGNKRIELAYYHFFDENYEYSEEILNFYKPYYKRYKREKYWDTPIDNYVLYPFFDSPTIRENLFMDFVPEGVIDWIESYSDGAMHAHCVLTKALLEELLELCRHIGIDKNVAEETFPSEYDSYDSLYFEEIFKLKTILPHIIRETDFDKYEVICTIL